jgi:putative hydrolase of the HAD superfamily
MLKANRITVISFDAEGTLVTPNFSISIWHEAVPRLYAKKNGLDFEEARSHVFEEYQRVGEHRAEWYDIKYWFRHFGLGDYQKLLDEHRREVTHYAEVKDVLESLGRRYHLTVTSGSPREFLDLLLVDIEGYFSDIFSSISDYGGLKNSRTYLQVCRDMGVEPGEVVHVGDNWDFDYIAAREAGIRAFFLDRSGEREGEDVVTDLGEFRARLS